MPSGENEPLDEDTFHREYEYHGEHDHLVHNVHYGCLQHWRSQCPTVLSPDLLNDFGDDRIVLTNREVKDLIIAQIKYWWKSAVDSKKSIRDSNFQLGHILKTVQASWVKSHVLRSSENTPSPAGSDIDTEEKGQQMAEGCGVVYLFQGGDAQDGNTKKALETATESSNFYQCSQYYSHLILKIFARCAEGGTDAVQYCDFDNKLKPLLDESVYPLSVNHAESAAGGSVEVFASPRIERLGYKKVQYDVEGMGPVTVWEPASSKMWGRLGLTDLQVPICGAPLLAKVKKFNGVSYRDETFGDFPNDSRGERVLEPVKCWTLTKRKQHAQLWTRSATGQCETHGWRFTAGCSTHKSCRPSKGRGCDGKCFCSSVGACRCLKAFDKETQKCEKAPEELK